MRLGVVLVLLATIVFGPAWADVEPTANVAEESKEIERQLALIQEQKKRIESQDGDIKALQQQLADMEQTLLSLARTPSALTADISHAPDRTTSPGLWRR